MPFKDGFEIKFSCITPSFRILMEKFRKLQQKQHPVPEPTLDWDRVARQGLEKQVASFCPAMKLPPLPDTSASTQAELWKFNFSPYSE